MNIIFRADASLEIGSGHIMRCLTLADALKEQGATCTFICREHQGNLISLIKDKGQQALSLPVSSSENNTQEFISNERKLAHADWLGVTQEEDAQQTLAVLKDCLAANNKNIENNKNKEKIFDWLVVDHYALDITWEKLVKPIANKILVIDDLADREHLADILLDQNLGKSPSDYQQLVPENCALLLGPEYALLQPEYAELRPRTPPRQAPIKNILIYFGGSDKQDLTGLATQACLQLNKPEIQLNVVMGSSYQYKSKLEELVQQHTCIQLHQNLPSLAPLMVQADLAIGAGGSTSWERCCLGLPAIIVTVAENQVPIAKELHQQKLVNWLGNIAEINIHSFKNLISNILNNNINIEDWSKRCFNLTKALGVNKLSGYLLLNQEVELQVRLANLDDEKLLLDWVNDPETQKNSFNTLFITPEQHRQWFYQKLRQPNNCKLYIVETDKNLPIGQVRFDWQEDKQAWQINYLLAPAARKNRLASKVLKTALEQLRKKSEQQLVIGEVKQSNLPSQKVFRNLNFNENFVNRGGGDGIFLFVQILS